MGLEAQIMTAAFYLVTLYSELNPRGRECIVSLSWESIAARALELFTNAETA